MKNFDFLSSSPLFIEIDSVAVRALRDDAGLELPVQRTESGRITPSSRALLIERLQDFLPGKLLRLRPHAWVAVGARGVSIRRLTLPRSSREDELQQVLELQMESEFPLAPDALAWGYWPLPNGNRSPDHSGQDVLVAALKRELIDDFQEILSQCGVHPTFTLGAFARTAACPARPDTYQVLELGRHHSEWVAVQAGSIGGIRMLPWGTDVLHRTVATRLGISELEASKQILEAQAENAPESLRRVVNEELENAAQALVLQFPSHVGSKLYLTGEHASLRPLRPALAQALQSSTSVEIIEYPPGHGRSAATIGLQRLWEKQNGAGLPLTLQGKLGNGGRRVSQPARSTWAVLAGLLLLVSLSLRYAEPVLSQRRLARRLAALDASSQSLPRLDRELGFLQYLQANQPPFLDALYVIAKAAPGGTQLDSVSMSRRGDVSLRGMMGNAQMATEFRSKLIDSGFFAAVILDEQAPAPDRQRVTFRMTAQWKPNGERPRTPNEPENATSPSPGGAPMAPGPMPVGMPFPPSGPMPGSMPIPASGPMSRTAPFIQPPPR